MPARPARPARRPAATRRRPPDPARRVAYDALRAVHAADAYANLVLASLLRERGLTGRDAAFATELLAGTCRFQGSYDLIIEAAAGRRLDSLQPAVVDLLRLGVHQVLAMRVPAHAAVAATVDLAVSAVGERVAGLVNAVLRRVAARTLDGWLADLSAGREGYDALAIRTGHPRWVVEAYADLLVGDELPAALAADNVSPRTALAVRPGLLEVADLVAAGAEPTGWSPYGATWTGDPGVLPAVREGRAGVQDEGSQLVALGLARAAAPAGWWLDLCAGPGGKTALLAGLAAADGSRVLATEIGPHRAQLVAQATRAYVASPAGRPPVVVADGTRPALRPGSFTRVLADVPCTGLGALRRRPEVRWRRRPDDVEPLHALQLALARTAADATRPGGILAYVTCSPHRRETSDVVEELLAERADLALEDAAALLPEVADADRGPYLQLWPHRHRTDAMFAAYLRRVD
ncbi:MAG: RsmB/NOP family class I SAM-dependent RNA methyltransferase [Actinomycetes bacterium]